MKRISAFFLVALLAGCGGSGGGSSIVPPGNTAIPTPPPAAGGEATATIKFTFGGGNATPASAKTRRPQFVSPNTEGILVQVYVHGSATVVSATAAEVSPGSSACGGSSSSTRTCSVMFSAPSGVDDYAFTTYDAAPATAGANGTFPKTANVLGTGSLQSQTVVAGQSNSTTAYISGAVGNVGVTSPTYISFPMNGKAQTFAFVIDPTDFDNNPITAGTNDPYSNAITATLTESDSGHAKLLLNGKAVFGNSVVLHQSSDSLSLAYDGQGKPGYGDTVALTAAGATTQTITLAMLSLTSSSPYYSSSGIRFEQPGQTATISVIARNAPSSVTYTASLAATGCTNVTTLGGITGSGANASVVATAGTLTATTCTVSVQDSTGTIATMLTIEQLIFKGHVTEYPVPGSFTFPMEIANGPDGNMWFTELLGTAVGKITTSGTITTYPVPGGDTYGIVTGPDNNLWATVDTIPAAILKITPSGTVTKYLLPNSGAFPEAIVAGPDGNLWFTETGNTVNAIGKITTSGTVTEYPIPTANSQPDGIVVGPDGNLWFTEGAGNNVGKLTIGGSMTEYPVPGGGSFGITTGPDGNLWYTNENKNTIGKITTTGVVTEYPIPSALSSPAYIVTGPGGNLWFAEANFGTVGEVTPSGAFSEYQTPTAGSSPVGIVVGPDGNVWFAELAGNIGKLVP